MEENKTLNEDEMLCPDCEGHGFLVDHSPEHCMNPNLDCYECGCPVQYPCEKCDCTGKVKLSPEGGK